MIIGIGSDLIDITRIAKVIERHGDRFTDRIFTDTERARAARRDQQPKLVAATYAKRFAAKEACSKALGTGIRQGVWWRDMGVVNQRGGRPTMVLTGGAKARLDADPGRHDRPDRPVDHRRMAARPGLRGDLGGPGDPGLILPQAGARRRTP
jgi:holo-[acyl-carrier protein] synthase